ncbi:MAG: hypothetical protein L6Q47_06165 [Ignavibacteriaceae bacterium]|nr:hypothetical protein [Ignavibacteriaceae bacterium]
MLKVKARAGTVLAIKLALLNTHMVLSAITHRLICITFELFLNNPNKMFTKSLRLLLIFFICAVPLFAQDSADTPNYALSFGISSKFKLTQYSGQIAVKKILENSDQIRLFINPFYEFSDYNSVHYNSPNEFQLNSSQWSINAGADYLWTAFKTDELLFYIGPGLSFYFSDQSGRQPLILYQMLYSESESVSYSAGVRGIIGTEWKVTQSIGLHSEYILLGLWNKSKTTEKRFEEETLARTLNYSEEHTIFESRLLFGLSVYF